MTTDNQTRKQFRAIGHKLSPVLIISNGLNDNISAELERALNDHELIKIRVNAADRDEKQTILDAICTSHRAELIQLTGHNALLQRAALKQKRERSPIIWSEIFDLIDFVGDVAARGFDNNIIGFFLSHHGARYR